MRLEWGCFGLILASTLSAASSLPGFAHIVNKSNHSDKSHRNAKDAGTGYTAVKLPGRYKGTRRRRCRQPSRRRSVLWTNVDQLKAHVPIPALSAVFCNTFGSVFAPNLRQIP